MNILQFLRRGWIQLGVFLLLVGVNPARADSAPYFFTTIAGLPGQAGSADLPSGLGSQAKFSSLSGIAFDSSGNAYVTDTQANVVSKITAAGGLTIFAGSYGTVGSADGTGSLARFNKPTGVTIDGSGNVYVIDSGNYTIRKITSAGVVTTLAGSPGNSDSVDATGAAARFKTPKGIAIDSSGNLFVTDDRAIRKITAAGAVTTFVGPSAASFNFVPAGITVDGAGNLFVTDTLNGTILKVTSSGTIATFNDFGSAGTKLSLATGITVDSAGNLYVADSQNFAVRKIAPGGTITTLAGELATAGFADGSGAVARFGVVAAIALDSTGRIYVTDSSNKAIRQITPAGITTTWAGSAGFRYPWGDAVDSAGNLYVADSLNHTIRKITVSGAVTTLAGSPGNTGSADGTGNGATFDHPKGVAVDGTGNVYVTSNSTVRKISAAGVVTTLAGTAGTGSYQDGTGAAAGFFNPSAITADSAGNLFVADGYNTIRKVTPAGVVTTFAGDTSAGSNDGVGTAANFNKPSGLAFDQGGNLYVADTLNATIRKITPAGLVSTFAGMVGAKGNVDGASGVARFEAPTGLAVDDAGNLFVLDGTANTIRQVTPSGVVTTIAGTAYAEGAVDGIGNNVRFKNPFLGLAVDAVGNLYVSDTENHTIRKGMRLKTSSSALNFTAQPGNLSAPVGGSVTFMAAAAGTSAPAYQWQKQGVNISGATASSFTISPAGTADAGSYTVVAINDSGAIISNEAVLTIATSAGISVPSATVTTGHGATFSAGGTTGSIQWQISTNNGSTWTNLSNDTTYSGVTTATLTVASATSALSGVQYRYVATANNLVFTSNAATLTVAQAFFPFPTCIVVDNAGNLYVGDAQANTIQKINASGQVGLLAGTSGTAGSADGTGAAARFNQPGGLALPGSGVVIVADTANATLRSITSAGVVTTLAGSAGNRGSVDGAGSTATFSGLTGLAVDSSGTVFVAGAMNDLIRKVTSSGAVSTLAGSAGVTGSTDGTGSAARFNFPTGAAVDDAGNIYVADTTNNLIRKVTSGGVVTTLAGVFGVTGSTDGTGNQALFNHPGGLTIGAFGALYLTDTGNSTIRKITPAGVVTTVAGMPGVAGLQDGTDNALFNQPRALTVDASGALYVADTGNAAIRKITPQGVVSTLALTTAPAPSGGDSSSGGSGGSSSGGSSGGSTTPPPSSSSGGGGAISGWFIAAMLALGASRWLTDRRQ